jgi:phosphate butyryltransferase
MPITKLEQVLEKLKKSEKKTIAVVAAEEQNILSAVKKAIDKNLIKAVLIGDKEKIQQIAKDIDFNISGLEIIDEKEPRQSAHIAVKLIREDKADVLVKGLVSTADYLKAILNKETGILPPKAILSHVTILEYPTYHKLLFVSDIAVILQPDLKQKIAMANYLINVCHKFEIEKPKVAMLNCSEKVAMNYQNSYDAAIVTAMSKRNQIKDAIIDGPIALDLAISKKSCKTKGFDSPIGGDTDAIVFGNIEACNSFYKAGVYLANAKMAGIITGAKVPVVLTSRSDSDESKFYSITVAALVGS